MSSRSSRPAARRRSPRLLNVSVIGIPSLNFFWHTKANEFIMFLVNAFSNTNFTDVYTGYKAIRVSMLRGLRLEAKSFTIEIELTVKLRRRRARFYEVPVTYHARTYEEGKKIRWHHAVEAVAATVYYRLARLS